MVLPISRHLTGVVNRFSHTHICQSLCSRAARGCSGAGFQGTGWQKARHNTCHQHFLVLSGPCVPKGQLFVWGRSVLSWAGLYLFCFLVRIVWKENLIRTALLFVVGFFKIGSWGWFFFFKYLGSFSSTKRLLKIASF